MFRTSIDLIIVEDVDSVDQIESAIRAGKARRYHIDEIERDPLPSGHSSRRSGVGIKRPDGSVVIEPHPWSA